MNLFVAVKEQLEQLPLDQPAQVHVENQEEDDLRQRWEQGRPDFKGVHAFENILVKLQDYIHHDHPIMSTSQDHSSQVHEHLLHDPDDEIPDVILDHQDDSGCVIPHRPDPMTFEFVLQKISAYVDEPPRIQVKNSEVFVNDSDKAIQVPELPSPRRVLDDGRRSTTNP